jgi:hypothetical protein
MTTVLSFRNLALAVAIAGVTAPLAYAQPKAEIGASLVNGIIVLGDDDLATVGIPGGGFPIFGPGMYASFFLGERFAIEPQLGLLWLTADGESDYLVNFVGQVDYFVLGTERSSPYVFATAGVFAISGDDYTPKSFGVGAGYRMPVGGRLTFRIDGRYTRFTSESEFDEGSNTVGFAVSIGGLFGQ